MSEGSGQLAVCKEFQALQIMCVIACATLMEEFLGVCERDFWGILLFHYWNDVNLLAENGRCADHFCSVTGYELRS